MVRAQRRIPASSSRAIAVLAFALAVAFVGDALAAGIVPGLAGDLASPTGLGYLYALAVVVIAGVAMSGRSLSLRLLLVAGLALFLERIFTLIVRPQTPDVASLGLHAIGALIALVLAFVCATILRSARGPRDPAAA